MYLCKVAWSVYKQNNNNTVYSLGLDVVVMNIAVVYWTYICTQWSIVRGTSTANYKLRLYSLPEASCCWKLEFTLKLKV